MLPSNHAIHDNTMESYTTSISWRSLEGQRNKTGAAMHCLSSSRPLSELARVFLVPVQPRDAVFPARILSCCPDLHTTWTTWLKSFEHILFLWCRHTSSIASAPVDRCFPFSAAILDGQRTQQQQHGISAPSSAIRICSVSLPCPPLPLPLSPFSLNYLYCTHIQ